MHLSRYTDYSLRTLIYLGLHQERVCTISEISDRYNISRNHLLKIVHRLGKAKLILTERGRNGSIRLARDPDHLHVGEVVRLMEDMALVECFDEDKDQCRISSACMLKGVLSRGLKAFLAELDQVTLFEILVPEQRLRDLLS